MVQIAENIEIKAMFVEKNSPIMYHVVFESTQRHSCLLSSTAESDFVDSKSKETENENISRHKKICPATSHFDDWRLVMCKASKLLCYIVNLGSKTP